jgi:PhnB protein
MAAKVAPIPPGYHALTPYIVVKDAARALDFYQKAFGARVHTRMDGPGGSVMHAEIQIGDSMLMLADEWPEYGNKAPLPDHRSHSLHLYVPDVDQAFERAIAAGCTVMHPLSDQFWGDRMGKLIDPFGHMWGLATHIEDVSDEECKRRAAAMFGGEKS